MSIRLGNLRGAYVRESSRGLVHEGLSKVAYSRRGQLTWCRRQRGRTIWKHDKQFQETTAEDSFAPGPLPKPAKTFSLTAGTTVRYAAMAVRDRLSELRQGLEVAHYHAA